MPIFVPPALYYGGIAALGAGARAINSPTGQNVIRGGINLLNKAGNKISSATLGNWPQYLQSLVTGSKFTPKGGIMRNVVGPSLTAPYLLDPKEGLNQATYFTPGATEAINKITGGDETGIATDVYKFGGSLIDALWGETEEEFEEKDKKEDKKEKKKETKKTEKDESIDDDSMPPSNWMDELIEAEYEAEKNKKEKNLKKGGYVKKQRKRKPYKSSSFAKMKKSKKRKYIRSK
jgi:hypothetical protein